MDRYLGVDGGGSKTAFALIDDEGRLLARVTAASSYHFSEGFDAVEQVLSQGITSVCTEAAVERTDITSAFFGLPGYGESSGDVEHFDSVAGRALGHDRYRCDNDMVCGWAGSLAGADGINVISGTGSMAYGERLGIGHRVGGWGELFGDEGSAYWIAAQGLNAFSRMSDGRQPRGPLYDLIRKRLGVAADLDAVGLVIDEWGGNRTSIAALATTVCEAVRHQDPAATNILAAAADELVTLVETTRVLIGFGADDALPVSYSGGMFCDDGFLTMFRHRLAAMPAAYELRRPLHDPAVGAALYAAKVSAHPLAPKSLDRLKAQTTADLDRPNAIPRTEVKPS